MKTHLTISEEKILIAIMKDEPQTTSDLVDLLYGHDPDGGPDSADGSVRVFIGRAKTLLRQYDVIVTGGYNRPYTIPQGQHEVVWNVIRSSRQIRNSFRGRHQAPVRHPQIGLVSV